MSTHKVKNSVLQTSRLVLRPLQTDDIDALWQLSAQPEVARFLWDNKPPSREHVSEILQMVLQAQRERAPHWAVFHQEAFIGHCGLRRAEEQPHLELIFAIDPKFWNRGLTTEAAGAVLNYGFQNMRLGCIIGQANPQNVASWRVLEKLGMRLVEEIMLNNEPLKLYEISHDEYSKNLCVLIPSA